MFDKIRSIIIYILMSVTLMVVGILFVLSVILMPSKMNFLGRLTSISVLRLLFVNVKINSCTSATLIGEAIDFSKNN